MARARRYHSQLVDPSPQGVESNPGASQCVGHGPDHQLESRGLSRRPPGGDRGGLHLGARVEDHLSDVDRAHAVDHGMVRFGQQRESPALEPLDQVHLPQGPLQVELPAHDARDELAQLRVGSRPGQGGAAHVVRDVEGLVVDPHRVRQVSGHPAHALAVSRHEGDAAADQRDEPVVVKPAARRLEDQHAAHMHGGGATLQIEEGHVEGAQPIGHPGSPPSSSPSSYVGPALGRRVRDGRHYDDRWIPNSASISRAVVS